MFKERFSEISLTELPPMRVACYRAVSKTPEEDAMSVLSQWMAETGQQGRPRSFGFEVDVTPLQASAGLRGYEVWFEVPPNVWPAPPVAIRTFPGGRAATLTIEDPFHDPFHHIPAGWGRLLDWAVANRIDPADHQCLEEVIERDGREDMILYLMLP